MLVNVRCPTCGLPIGDIALFWKKMRSARVKEVLGVRNTISPQAGFDAGLQIDCKDILDKLQILKSCCRAHLICAMEFHVM